MQRNAIEYDASLRITKHLIHPCTHPSKAEKKMKSDLSLRNTIENTIVYPFVHLVKKEKIVKKKLFAELT